MTLLLSAVVVALIGAGWVIYPILFQRWGLVSDRVSGQLLDREAKKRVALAALKDVEYDRAAGKLDDTDYADLRRSLELEALDAMQEVESAAESASAPLPPHSCGFANPPGSRYCAGCGKPLT